MKNFYSSLIFFLIISLSNANAFCLEPDDPPSTFYKPSKPIVPYCVNEYSNTHTCDDWEIDSYNTEVEMYNYNLRDYKRRLLDYHEEVTEYVECELRYL